MNIKLITKERYYSILGKKEGKVEYTILNNITIENYPSKGTSGFVYFLNDTYQEVFVYFVELKKALIPKSNLIDPLELVKGEFTLDNWKLEYIGEEKCRKYLLNTIKYNKFYNLKLYDYECYFNYQQGNYKISNLDFPGDELVKNFTLYRIKDYVFEHYHMAWPEKMDSSISTKKKIEMSDFILIILSYYGNRQDNKGVDKQSE